MDKEIISSHIFIFPFRWDVIKDESCLNTCIDSRLNVQEFIECLKGKDSWKIDSNITNIIENGKVKDDKEYNTYSYFYSNVKDAIYGKKKYIEINKYKNISTKNVKYYFGKLIREKMCNRIVTCLNYENINENSIYEIDVEKRDDEGKKFFNKAYQLKIKHIKLKVYDTGVATLSYFLENNEYKKQDILKINDYGRRIYPQYIPLDSVQNSFLAKKLCLKLKNGTIEESFDYGIKEEPTRISKTIIGILGDRFISTEKELKEKCPPKEESIFIRPVIDDRMFTICYYSDNFCSEILTNFDKDEYLKSDFWYEFLFIDNGGATCQDEKMNKELLSKSTYTRWKDYGTLFGVSRYSFVLLCNESEFSKSALYNHINTIYYEMVLLALVQRASILRFSDETSRIATNNFGNEYIYEKIKKLQQYYIRFVNTIYFREVTAQEQGIELYDKLMELMRIEKEVKRLDEEIDEIQRYITLETNEKTNKLLNIVTFAGLGISFTSLVSTIFGNKQQIDYIKRLLQCKYIPFIIAICIIIGFKKSVDNNKLMKIMIVIMTALAVFLLLNINYFLKLLNVFIQ